MKVLIVSFWFPPSNVAGAVRIGKLARYLHLRGHDLRVLTTDIGVDRSLPLEIPSERVIYTDYRRREDRLAHFVQSFWQHAAAASGTGGERSSGEVAARGKSLREWLQRQHTGFTNIPDSRRGWIKIAVPAGRRLIEKWKPDTIFASTPPFTGLIVADRLSRLRHPLDR